MQLKTYQQNALRHLEQYIYRLNGSRSLATAYAQYWADKGVDIHMGLGGYLRPYVNSVKGVPRVTLKVPTAGGKTFMACHAIKRIMDALQTDAPNRVVAWFVPSDTILKQTLEKLQDAGHPYRQTLDALFAHRVTVVDKEAALTAQGISPAQLRDNLTILVLSAQSFVETVRVKNAGESEQMKPRAYRENGYLMEHARHIPYPDKLIKEADPTALINVVAQQHPLVIVDESHNFRADLRVELLENINPRFILELTATPREGSNIISFVDAMQLKREHMVKLPVIVENRHTPKDVLVSAIRLRRSLEQRAKEMEQGGGRHIRPIVLFQAQPKTDKDNETFDKIKANLISFGIPEEEIKIKTATKDELRGIDLLSRDCPVRYIITVDALKEGWDCPFAYILATLANKTSRVSVEQILGRILRQPYTTQHADLLLNLAYVFTSSNDFRDTVERIILSLQKSGFSRKDYREVNLATPQEAAPKPDATPTLFDPPNPSDNDEAGDGINLTAEETLDIKHQTQVDQSSEEMDNFEKRAAQMGEDYNEQMNQQADGAATDPLAAIAPKDMSYPINEHYREVAAGMSLPIFYTRTAPSIFSSEGWMPLEKTMLTEGFDLPAKDATVDFTIVRPTGVTIDVAEAGDDYVPVRRSNSQTLEYIRQQYVDKSATRQKELLSKQIASMIRLDNVPEPHIRQYVAKVIENLDADEISSLVDNLYLTRDAILHKIESLLKEHQKQMFQRWLDIGRVQLDNHYTFMDVITIAKEHIIGIGKSLYAAEETVNDFEYAVISAIADNENVLFWHRNRERKDFCINGFINHYPDFIVRMRSGRTLLIETKGDHLVNDDSKNKIWLGNKWADLAGNKYKYFMVFQSQKVEGAITVQQLMQYLNEL